MPPSEVAGPLSEVADTPSEVAGPLSEVAEPPSEVVVADIVVVDVECLQLLVISPHLNVQLKKLMIDIF